MTTENGDVAPITEGKMDGDQISFKIPTDEGAFVVTGKVTGTEIKGAFKTPNGMSGTYSGTKQ
jgi:hypothetical protein